jgi:hypothetical protein
MSTEPWVESPGSELGDNFSSPFKYYESMQAKIKRVKNFLLTSLRNTTNRFGRTPPALSRP